MQNELWLKDQGVKNEWLFKKTNKQKKQPQQQRVYVACKQVVLIVCLRQEL